MLASWATSCIGQEWVYHGGKLCVCNVQRNTSKRSIHHVVTPASSCNFHSGETGRVREQGVQVSMSANTYTLIASWGRRDVFPIALAFTVYTVRSSPYLAPRRVTRPARSRPEAVELQIQCVIGDAVRHHTLSTLVYALSCALTFQPSRTPWTRLLFMNRVQSNTDIPEKRIKSGPYAASGQESILRAHFHRPSACPTSSRLSPCHSSSHSRPLSHMPIQLRLHPGPSRPV